MVIRAWRVLAALNVLALTAAAAVVLIVGGAQPGVVRAADPLRVVAWAPYWEKTSSLNSFTANQAVMSELTPMFWYASGATGTISRYASATAADVTKYRNAATAAGKPIVATVFDGMSARGMSNLLSTAQGRTAHVENIMSFVTINGFDGIDIDYEQFAFADGRATWPATYTNWGLFLEELGGRLHALGKTLSVAVPPVYDAGQTSASGYWVYNYAAVGQFADNVRIMTYSYSGNAAGVISPYWWVEQSMRAAAAIVPPEKIQMGIAS
ncbi:MAG TPA: glycosyl hydrolase family 18 protein, partial [Ilumatobacteraceae bacterium]|nr:glycosyl hydrolase family 18 protein [Ilumatobacteraceae bacterium]